MHTTCCDPPQPQFCLRCAIHSEMVTEDSASTTYYIKQAAINNINVFMRMFMTRPVLLCSISCQYRAHRNVHEQPGYSNAQDKSQKKPMIPSMLMKKVMLTILKRMGDLLRKREAPVPTLSSHEAVCTR